MAEGLKITKPDAGALLNAVENGDENAVECLLKAGTESNVCDGEGKTSLILAIEHGHTQIVRMLLDHNADIKFYKYEGVTRNPLIIAAKKGSVDIVKLLVQHGSKHTWIDYLHWTASSLASGGTRGDAHKAIIKLGRHLDPDTQDRYWRTFRDYDKLLDAMDIAKHPMVRRDRVETILDILKRESEYDQNGLNTGVALEYRYGHIELKEAARFNKAELVNVLLQGGVSFCDSALGEAVYLGHTEVVEIFLKAGAPISAINSAFPHACARDHLEIAKLLQIYGGSVNATTRKHRNHYDNFHLYDFSSSGLYEATCHGYHKITRFLLLNDVDVRPEIYYKGRNVYYEGSPNGKMVKFSIIDVLLYKKNYKVIPSSRETFIKHCNLLCASGATIRHSLLHSSDTVPRFALDDQNPLAPLQNLCRRVIREYMLRHDKGNQNNLLTGVPQLPLPLPLKKYLVHFDDIPDEDDAQFLCGAVARQAHLIPRAPPRV